MLLQVVSFLIPGLTSGLIAYLIYYLSCILENGGAQVFLGLNLLLEKTPAFNTFLVFISKATYFATLVLCAFGRTSKHIIITLDILYLISLLILILYHTYKQSGFSNVA